jgi:hypothetical protein
MTIDCSYESFRLTTLRELWAEPGIWELYADAASSFPAAGERERVAIVARLLGELYDEGWATFVRRPWDRGAWSAEAERALTDEEVRAAIASASWRVYPYGDDANVWLVPTDKALAWQVAGAEARDSCAGDRG